MNNLSRISWQFLKCPALGRGEADCGATDGSGQRTYRGGGRSRAGCRDVQVRRLPLSSFCLVIKNDITLNFYDKVRPRNLMKSPIPPHSQGRNGGGEDRAPLLQPRRVLPGRGPGVPSREGPGTLPRRQALPSIHLGRNRDEGKGLPHQKGLRKEKRGIHCPTLNCRNVLLTRLYFVAFVSFQNELLVDKYSKEMSVGDILEMYPDPESYFGKLDRKVSDLYKQLSLAHLKREFRQIMSNPITQVNHRYCGLYVALYFCTCYLIIQGGIIIKFISS